MPSKQSQPDSRYESPENNPCIKEHRLSLKCVSDNYKNKDEACAVYFDNYKACKKFWGRIADERKQKGITPFLPPVEERDKIKNDYLSQFKKK